jgi:hypothetical protein
LYDTVGGFTCDCFDHIPGVGESILVHLPAQTGYDDDAGESGGGHRDSDSGGGGDGDGERGGEQGPACRVRAVRLTVTDGGTKMVRAVQARVVVVSDYQTLNHRP